MKLSWLFSPSSSFIFLSRVDPALLYRKWQWAEISYKLQLCLLRFDYYLSKWLTRTQLFERPVERPVFCSREAIVDAGLVVSVARNVGIRPICNLCQSL